MATLVASLKIGAFSSLKNTESFDSGEAQSRFDLVA